MKKLFVLSVLALCSLSVFSQSCPDKKHPHAIDLGLPSGTKWACCNVGASKPKDYGDHYLWGAVSRPKWDESWKTPSREQLVELTEKCLAEWTSIKGVNGYRFTASNGQSIFLPAAGTFLVTYRGVGTYGFYRSLTPNPYINGGFSYYMYFDSGTVKVNGDASFDSGFSIRYVQ